MGGSGRSGQLLAGVRKTVRGRPDGKLQATPAVPVDALTGRDKLSLVFKSPQDNAFDVDAVQFSNP
ncbi:hypothetical protein ACFVFJ_14160 [Streptomyces sp. NPDC057717]|uniref:hypothetical protein n=1 Tax=Streptomyces sp. NPDC057717 TaxID=3346224 RepID=UPI0036B35082